MPYLGHAPTNSGNFYILDDFNGLGQDGGTSTYDQNANGTIVNFKLMVAGVAITPNVDNLIVTIDGVLQHPTDAYTISGSILTFTGAPASGVDFHVVIMGQSSTVGEGSIGADELQVSGDGTNNQLLKSDGDGTMSWINQNTVTASTAATLATARTIGGTSFNGSANIAVALAATATTLATTRAINGVNFDGSAAITVTADANTLSNTTLKSTVVSSSLTSVGILTSLTGGTGDLVWDTTTLVVDSSANKVGIGTASPSNILNITHAGETGLFIHRSGASGGDHNLMMNTDNVVNNTNKILFNVGNFPNGGVGESGNTTYAGIEAKLTQVNTQKGQLRFYVNTGDTHTTALTLNDSGNATFAGTTTKLSNANAQLWIGEGDGASDICMSKGDTGDEVRFSKNQAGSLDILTNAGVFHLNVGGDVGIGQGTPQSDNSTARFLHIGSSSNATSGLVLEDNEAQWEIQNNGHLRIMKGSTNVLELDMSSSRATFAGDIKIADDLYFNSISAWLIASGSGGTLRVQTFDELEVDGVLDINGTGENTFAGRVEITNSADATALRIDQSDNDGYGINVDCSHGTYVGRGIGMTFARARSADYYILEAHDSGGTMFSVKGDGTLYTATAGSSIAQESWNEVTPNSPFTNYGGDWDTCGYMKAIKCLQEAMARIEALENA